MKKLTLFLISCFCLISCDDELQERNDNIEFNDVSLLNSVVENHILPEFAVFRSDVEALGESKDVFITEKTEANLVSLRSSYLQAYNSYQAVAKYDFGLALDINFAQNLNLHPFNLNGVTDFILNQENQNLESILTQNRQGFPAVDYMLNGLATTDTEIVAFYTGNNAEDYTIFLSRIIDRIEALTIQVDDDWRSGFADSFTNENGFLDIFVNSYIQYFEKRLRSSKVDFPAGKFDGTPSPETIESFFRPEESRGLLLEALESSRLLYIGVGENSTSLSSVLVGFGEEGLDAQIRLRFLEAQNLISSLDANLAQQVATDNSKMLDARDALQEIVRLLKVDLVSVLNITITFQDNDGD